MKVSIITVCFNSVKTIKDTIESVISQTYKDIEYIIVDGVSTDETMDVIEVYKDKISKIISEPDDGLYDAMNKGIKIATGDIVGIINSDDFYTSSNIIEKYVEEFKNNDIDACYADVVYINDEKKPVRYYSSKKFNRKRLKYGLMPAHPSLFLKKGIFEEFGYYKKDYEIGADFEFIARVFKHEKIKYRYLQNNVISMRMGGVSTSGFKSHLVKYKEVKRACKENSISTSSLTLMMKYPLKLLEFKN